MWGSSLRILGILGGMSAPAMGGVQSAAKSFDSIRNFFGSFITRLPERNCIWIVPGDTF
jgi:hypothetical protein